MEDRHGRVAVRRKLFRPAELRFGTKVDRVHLLDLSASGARGHCAVPPDVGSRVLLSCGATTKTARVAWVRGQMFGVHFTMPMSEDQLEAMLDIAAPRMAVAAR